VELQVKRVLVLCAHTDDEVACSGSISKFVRQGSNIHYVALSRCEESLPRKYPSETLFVECSNALNELDIPENRRHIYNLPVRNLPSYRQEILDIFRELDKTVDPDLVLMPSFHDVHQDHQVVCTEGYRAFKYTTILGYEVIHNNLTFKHSAFIKLSSQDLAVKIRSASCYKSQEDLERTYMSYDFIHALAKIRGAQCNTEYAEGFEIVRIIA
jgi:LmbE family N-acetylglucosaminyl deacetylase